MTEAMTYKAAGVDVDAGSELIRRIAPACRATHRPETLSGLGGFAALSEIPAGYRQPVLVAGTDGVGTKLKLAIDQGAHAGIGQDLVAMCANDVLVTGAEPFLFLDYFATGRLNVEVAEVVVKGIAAACQLAGCALAGGETAEMPGFYAAGDYDVAGFCLGVVERDRIIDGSRLAVGDALIGLHASGPHSNGYSLIRRILEREAPTPQVAEALLAPTRIYVRAVHSLLSEHSLHGIAHITGGGLTDNAPRMFASRPELAALIDTDAWPRPDVFRWLQAAGNIEEAEMLRTFNCGIGMLLCLPQSQASKALKRLRQAGERASRVGRVVAADSRPQSGQILLGA